MPNQDGVLLSAITRGTRRNRRGFESMEFETRLSRVESVDVTSTGDGDCLKSGLPARGLDDHPEYGRQQMPSGVRFSLRKFFTQGP